MMYTVIYIDKNDGIRKWKKASDLMTAKKFASDNCNGEGYDICVPLYEYGTLEARIKIMKNAFEQIETIVGKNK